MGLMNVYNFAKITNWHLPFRFKATFKSSGDDDIRSFSVKSISKPRFPLGTDSINQYYGTTRFVMPTIEFDKATMDITFVEEDSGVLQDNLLANLGSALNTGGGAITNIRIDEYDMSMTELLSSRVYTCQLKSVDMPEYSRSGSASIVTVTAHFVVHAIYNTSLTIDDLRNPTDESTSKKLAEETDKDNTKVADKPPVADVTPKVAPPPQKPPSRLAGDDPMVVAAKNKRNEASTKMDKSLDLIYSTMRNNSSVDIINELDKAGFDAYKSDHNRNGNTNDRIDEAGRRAEWDNMSDADKMRYILLSQGINVTDGISDDANTKDYNGKTEYMRLLDTLALISGSENVQDIAAYANMLVLVSAEEKKAAEDVDNAIKVAEKKIEQENAKYEKELAEYNKSFGITPPVEVAPAEGAPSTPSSPAPLVVDEQDSSGNDSGAPEDPKTRYTYPDYKGAVPPAEMLTTLPKESDYGKMAKYFKPNEKMSRRSSINNKYDVKNEQFYMTKYSWMNMAFKDDLTVGEQKTILKTRYGLSDDDFTSTEKLSDAMDKANRRLVEAGSTERIWNTIGLCGAGTSWLYGMVNLADDDKFYQGENDKNKNAWDDAVPGLLITQTRNLKSEENYAFVSNIRAGVVFKNYADAKKWLAENAKVGDNISVSAFTGGTREGKKIVGAKLTHGHQFSATGNSRYTADYYEGTEPFPSTYFEGGASVVISIQTVKGVKKS